MMMILSGAWPQATAWPAGPGGRGRRPRPGRAPARPAAAEPAPAPAGPQGQAMACARYKDGSLAAEPLISHNFINGTIEIDTVFLLKMNTESCSLSIMLTVTGQNRKKIIKKVTLPTITLPKFQRRFSLHYG